MAVAPDTSPALASYAAPERLVTADWLGGYLGDPRVTIIEVSAEQVHYHVGHIPGARRINAQVELVDVRHRDIVSPAEFADLLGSMGISRDDTVVLYGDCANAWAAFALWVFTIYGHPDVRLLDGGRDLWFGEGRDSAFDVSEPAAVNYPIPGADRSFFASQADLDGARVLDCRGIEEFAGKSDDCGLRAGHIPEAINLPWRSLVSGDGRFLPRSDLDRIVGELDGRTITYGRIGELSCHTWFVLHYLLGLPEISNYFGGWAEWANTVGAPIETGGP